MADGFDFNRLAQQMGLGMGGGEGGGENNRLLDSLAKTFFGISLRQGESNPLSLANAAPLKNSVPSMMNSLNTRSLIPLDFSKYLTRDITDHTSGIEKLPWTEATIEALGNHSSPITPSGAGVNTGAGVDV